MMASIRSSLLLLLLLWVIVLLPFILAIFEDGLSKADNFAVGQGGEAGEEELNNVAHFFQD
jgi:hypothetical protein